MRFCELSSGEEIEVLLNELKNLVQTGLDEHKEILDYAIHFLFSLPN